MFLGHRMLYLLMSCALFWPSWWSCENWWWRPLFISCKSGHSIHPRLHPRLHSCLHL